MLTDKYSNRPLEQKDSLEVSFPTSSENYHRHNHWEVIDTLIYTDGRKEVRKYHNLVVDNCSKLLASLMLNKSGFKGISYWAVGSGDKSWNNDELPSPLVTDTKLTKETFRKAIPSENIIFLNEHNEPSEEVTNKIQVSIEFTEEEANGELREFSLWGGDATGTKDSGIMINRKIHPLITKTNGMKLKRVIRITF